MRDAFINELIEAAEHKNIALVVGDLGYSVVESFAEAFPDRFFNAGVSEQNMMGLCAGLASEGFHVFVYSIGNFPTFRCAEQVRNDVDYHNLPVTIVAVGGGVAYGNMGYSHHAIQDYALMRSMPNMMIASPGDPMEVRACMRYLINNPGPSYLRLGKAGEFCMHENVPIVKPGVWLPIYGDDTSKTYLCTGAILQLFHKMHMKNLLGEYAVKSMPLWSMNSKNCQSEEVQKYTDVITVENHLKDGGFGSWMLESVNASLRGRVTIKALDSKICGMVGREGSLHDKNGLSLRDLTQC